MIWYWTKCFG